LATCFDPVGASSCLHYEPINDRNPWDPNNVYKDKCKRFMSNDFQYVKNIIAYKTQ
jgi:hypothetical protein